MLSILLFILFIGGICLTLLFGFNFAVSFTTAAQDLYGPASPRLTTLQFYKLSYELVRDQDLLLTPANPSGEKIQFTVESGESADFILGRLQAQNMIKSYPALRNYIIYKGLDTQIQAGDYFIDPSMTAIEIILQIVDFDTQIVEFNILPGWRLEEIAESLPSSGLDITPQQFINAASTRPPGISFVNDLPPGANLEGFFLPGSYPLSRDMSVNDLVHLIVSNFDTSVTSEMRDAFGQKGLTLTIV